MHPTFAALLRPIATIARNFVLLAALAAPMALAPDAHAQLGRQLPSPVSAAQLEQMIRDAGLPETTKDAALPLHEAYFARFRDFEKRELDPLLSKPSSTFDIMRSVEDAKKEADLRRRAFQRAAQLDGQLADEIEGVLPAEDAWRTRMLKAAMSRRRAAALGSNFGFAGKPLEFTLRSAPVFNTLDPDTRRMANLALEVYEAELTRLLERYADAALARIVKAAEIREEVGLTAPPQPEGDAAAGEATPAGDEWFRKMQDIQKRANEDVDKAVARIRKHHRDGLDQIMPILPALDARALRDHMVSGIYPALREKSEFDAVFDTAKGMRAKEEIDDFKWKSVIDIAEANEHSGRPVVLSMMDIIDRRAGDSQPGMIIVGGDPDPETREQTDALRKQLRAIEESSASTLRAMLGIAEPEKGDGRGVVREGINLADVIGGAAVGGDAEAQIGIAIVGSAGGDAIVLDGNDMAESGMIFSAMGGGTRVPRPMSREELDALATKLGFNKDSRAVFDEIAARCTEARNAAEKEFKSAPAFQAGDGENGMSFTITLGGDGEAEFGGADNEKLAAAVETAEEAMFDELKAAAENADAVEQARRARARMRLVVGESGASALDLVKVAEDAKLAAPAQARIADGVRAWDETSVGALRTMKSELKVLQAEREEIFQESTEEVTNDDGNGSVNVSRSMKIEGETAERLQKLEERISATRTRVATANRRALAGMLASLDGDEAAQRLLRRAAMRAEFPQIYRTPRDLEPYFTKAGAIEGVTASCKTAIDAVRAEWVESRESRCEDYCTAQQKAAEASLLNPDEGISQMQARMRERKKLREDLEQIESTCFRKLQEALIVDVGAEKAKELGELPARKRPQMPMIQIGN